MLESLMIHLRGPLAPEAPSEFGTFWEGGYYTGKIGIDGKIYALVVAPITEGESLTNLAWKTTDTLTPGTASLNDGWTNTQAMVAAGINLHPAGKFCHDLVINGYDDWYLPSVNELELCYRNLKPTTDQNFTAATGSPNGALGYNPASIPIGEPYTTTDPMQTKSSLFKTTAAQAFKSDYYITSTQAGASNVFVQFLQRGSQGRAMSKLTTYKVRAMRRVLIG